MPGGGTGTRAGVEGEQRCHVRTETGEGKDQREQ